MELCPAIPPHPISVVICTFNRLPLLTRAVESVLAQRHPYWELIVVDNNCTDGTCQYLEALASADPRIRWLHEPRQGVAHARNRGARAADHGIIAFCDDDQQADPLWLEELAKVFHVRPDVGCLSGPTILADQYLIPFRFRKIRGVLGDACMYSPPDGQWYLTGRTGLFGGNLAVRKEAFFQVGGFPDEMGRYGGTLKADEDILFSQAVFDAGYQLAYNPKAICHHALLPSRMTFSYLRRHARGMALTRARRGRLHRYLAEAIYKTLCLILYVWWPPSFTYQVYRAMIALFKIEAALRLYRDAAAPLPANKAME